MLLNNHRQGSAAFTVPPFTLSFPHSCSVHHNSGPCCPRWSFGKKPSTLMSCIQLIASYYQAELLQWLCSIHLWLCLNTVCWAALASAAPPVETMCVHECVHVCVCPPAAEASCSGASAVLSCPLRTAAPSTLAPASSSSCTETHTSVTLGNA